MSVPSSIHGKEEADKIVKINWDLHLYGDNMLQKISSMGDSRVPCCTKMKQAELYLSKLNLIEVLLPEVGRADIVKKDTPCLCCYPGRNILNVLAHAKKTPPERISLKNKQVQTLLKLMMGE